MLPRTVPITPESWRWVMLVGGAPVLLGALVLKIVPESPRWLAGRSESSQQAGKTPVVRVFQPPLLGRTLIGICLGTIPLLGAWGCWSFGWLRPRPERSSSRCEA